MADAVFRRLFDRIAAGLASCLTGLLMACPLLALPQQAMAAPPTPLSSCIAAQGGNLTIGPGACGPSVVVDKSYAGTTSVGYITIVKGGTLTIADVQGLRLDTAGIAVQGALVAGSAQKPISNRVTINFTESSVTGTATTTIPKGISVMDGTLKLHGKTGVARGGSRSPSWTHLAAPSGPPALYGKGQGVGNPVASDGATVLRVADTVDWTTGSWIVVAGTDFSPDSAEFVRIHSVSCGTASAPGCKLTLDPATPLTTYHYGGKAPDKGAKAFRNGVAQNYGVDERAEVGLISRNIKLTASVPSTGTGTATAHGGEIMIMGKASTVAIQGVEIEKFGKARLGSYPIHFHQVGTFPAGAVVVDSNSIHHSYNKCVTLHSTNGVTVSNNVCARAVGHLFYMEAGDETGNSFINNLGIGAMSNAMSNPVTVTATGWPNGNTAAAASFWSGDYLVNGTVSGTGTATVTLPGNGYNGFNIPFTDEGSPVGVATTSSGFWIPSLGGNTYTGNSVAGCQAFGRGFWILPGTAAAATGTGTFANNRAHGCYAGFDTASDDGVTGALLYTPQGTCVAGSQTGTATNCDLIAHFDSLTATRNRNRGIWVRASWYALTNARLATNRDSVSLVSSGGTEGSPPGEWSLLRDAIIVGISANNVLRFGPCPYNGQNGFGGNAGCYEPVWGNGYPVPSWNFAGMMFYDGPARLEHVHFVNFNKDIKPYLTSADLTYFNNYANSGNAIPCQPASASSIFTYEGDAAMGWFQSNENSYPPTQYVENLSFRNVDLRHQVYTQNVQLTCATTASNQTIGNFRDGDKFTVILDRDSSLTGLQVVPPGTQTTNLKPVPGVYPISLNNIPFLAGPGTADECLSTGQQDQLMEGRPTSLISPYNYATLEFSALTAPCNGLLSGGANCTNNNVMVFTKDQADYGGTLQFTDTVISSTNTAYTFNCGSPAVPGAAGTPGHACVALSGRNGNGVYEPKLVNGLGYTVGATAGMPNFVSLMYGDASVPGGISPTNPFSTRIGICYKNQGQAAPPASAFTVRKGGKSFASVNNANTSTLAPLFFNELQCTSLDNTMCIASGTPYCYTSLCPSPPLAGLTSTLAPMTPTLPQVTTLAALNDPAQCPRGECYFYDQGSGMLFLNMVQEKPNAGGPYSSPLGSCNGTKGGYCAQDNFYSCPAGGCELYTVSVNTATYVASGPSECTPYSGSPTFAQPYPASLNRLAYTNGTAIRTALVNTPTYPHMALTKTPPGFCPVNAPATADWPASTSTAVIFTPSPPGTTTLVVKGAPTIAGFSGVPLTPGQTYTMVATVNGSCTPTTANPYCACQQYFNVTPSGTGFTSASPNCCGMGVGTITGTILPVATGPYSCLGPNPPAPPPAAGNFFLGLPSGIAATLSVGTGTVSVSPAPFSLSPSTTYTLSASSTSPCTTTTGAPYCACQQNLTVNGAGTSFTTAAGGCCAVLNPAGGSGPVTISVGNVPYICQGP